MPFDTPPHPQLAVSATIFRDARILLLRRAHAPGKGLWSLPGGRVEFGESLQTALRREVMEETTLLIDVVALAGWREVLPGPANTGHYVVMSFAARWVGGEPALNDEHDDVQWLAPDALHTLQVTDGLPDIVRAARRIIEIDGPRA